MLTTTLT